MACLTRHEEFGRSISARRNRVSERASVCRTSVDKRRLPTCFGAHCCGARYAAGITAIDNATSPVLR
jgi:hypothetical protein